MSMQGLRLSIFFVGTLGFAAGCRGVPPLPESTNTRPHTKRNPGDPYDADSDGGWLQKRLTGHDPSGSDPLGQQQGVPANVVPASAAEPADAPPAAPPAASNEEEDSGFELSDLAPKKVYERVRDAAGYGPNEGVARELIKEGHELFQQEEYAEASDRFKSAAGRWPDSTLEEDALFLLGESYFFSDQYPKAQDSYEELLEKHANSRYLDTVTKRLFWIGRYWEKLHRANPHWPVTPNLTDKTRPRFDTFGRAINAYLSVSQKDPRGEWADDAIMATATAYFDKGRWVEAAFHYNMLRRDYPNSEHQAEAHRRALASKLRIYQGEKYDCTPLDEADDIASQMQVQFRGEPGQGKKGVAAVREQIVEEKAKRDWTMAQFYEKKSQYGAARFYYHGLIKEYPLSQHARQARVRLEQIRDKPDNPPQRLKWLTDRFARDR